MKKILAFLVALVLFIIIVWGYNYSIINELAKNKNNLYFNLSDEKFNSMESAKICLNNKDSNNILILGSSELSAFDSEFTNYGDSDFNVYLFGRGYTQSLQSALALGAINKKTGIDKVVLILSPQWFENDITPEIFSSRFQKDSFLDFMNNSKISYDTKSKIIEELKKLEIEDKNEYERMQKIENAYLNYNLCDRISLNIKNNIRNTKNNIKLLESLNNYEKNDNKQTKRLKYEEYNFKDKIIEAEENMKKDSNNEFKISDYYYNTYIKSKLKERKDSKKNEKFDSKIELEHFKLFLTVCNDLGIKPLIVNIPVNGLWYDYVGVDKNNRDNYYKMINRIAVENNAEIANFSEYEYEEYFLKDIMHLGEKGWVMVNEKIYEYVNKK